MSVLREVPKPAGSSEDIGAKKIGREYSVDSGSGTAQCVASQRRLSEETSGFLDTLGYEATQCGEQVGAVLVSSPDELHTGDHVLYPNPHMEWSGDKVCSALFVNMPEDGRLRVITADYYMDVAREEIHQFSSLAPLHKVQYASCLYSVDEAVQRARSGRPHHYRDSHMFVSWVKTGREHFRDTIIAEVEAQCGKPVGAVPVSSPEALHTGDHVLYHNPAGGGAYLSSLVVSEPEEDGRIRVNFPEKILQFSSLAHLHKVQYTTPCLYSVDEAVERARSGRPHYRHVGDLVSWVKTGLNHSLGTFISQLKDQCGKPVKAVPVSAPEELHTGDHIIVYDDPGKEVSSLVVSEPDDGCIRVITKPSRSGASKQETLHFSSLAPLYKVQYTSCLYSGEQVVQRARSKELDHWDNHVFVSLAKTGVIHNLGTIIKEVKDYHSTQAAIAPIRGCQVVAERDFPITQKAEVFNWSEYGITISAPENSLPENVGCPLLNVRVTLSGPFQLGAAKLMSAVYWLCPNIRCKFAKPLELTVEHCAHLKHPDDHTKLTFLRTKCNQKDLPYKFEEIGGNFTAHTGTVALRSFSGLAVGSKAAESAAPPMKCLARIVTFQTHVTEWNTFCAILKDLKSFREFDSKKKVTSDQFTPSLLLEFKEDTVRLDLPVSGITVENWKIQPLVPPRLSRPDANHYEPSEDFPECCFAIEWVGTGNPCTTLHHVVKMLGTADEDDFIALRVNPGARISGNPSVQSPTPDETTDGEGSSLSRLCAQPKESELMIEATCLKPQTLFTLAITLGLTISDVCNIEVKTLDPLRRFMELFDLWQAKASSPYTWETFVKALEDSAVGENAVAAKLRRKLSHP